MLKKTTIAVLGLAVSSLATAGTMGPVCTPGNVTVPCEAKLWELGAEALYLRSIYGADKALQVRIPSVNGFATGPEEIVNVKNDWNWGYRLMGAYHFNTGNDVSVNWMHFSTTANRDDLVGEAVVVRDRLVVVPLDLVDRNRLDQVNIVMGQHVDLGMRDKMRFYAGMQYANIQSMISNDFSGPFVPVVFDTPSVSLFNNTDYKGFGPSIGLDYSYDLINGLSLTANGAGSILYGTTRYHAGLVANQFGVIAQQIYASKKSIVPSLEAKLGLNYAYNMAQGVVNIDAGYQVVNYFNPLSTQQFQNILNPSITSVNYGLFGPYFGLKYVGNA